MTEQELFDKIEAYLRRRLPEAEREAFERQIAENPALAEEVEMHHFEHEAMEVLVEQRTRAKMAKWAAEASPPDRTPPWRWMLPGLAAVALLTALFLWWRPATMPPASEQRVPSSPAEPAMEAPRSSESAEETAPIAPTREPAAEEASPTAVPPPVAESVPPEPAYLALATELYGDPEVFSTVRSQNAADQLRDDFEAGNYAAVVAALREALPEDLPAQQLLGHAYFRMGRYADAASAFDQVLQGDDPALAEEVDYYYLLAQLAQGRQDTPAFAEGLQRLLDDPDHPYYLQARELAARLR